MIIKKQIYLLIIIILSSCHVHYHIQGKEISVKEDDTKPLIISGSARLYNVDYCNSPGCMVYHGSPNLYLNRGNIIKYQHAAGELSENDKAFFKSLNDTIK